MVKPKNYVLAGYIDVDAGSIWVGDGCYVLKDSDEQRPADFGKKWGDICDRFFDRSGYNERSKEWRAWSYAPINEWSKQMGAAIADGSVKEKPYVSIKDFETQWRKDNPFKPTAVDKGFACFNHDGGHSGMGIMISTNYGDGTYPVYIKYGKNGRPSKVLIDFGDDTW